MNNDNKMNQIYLDYAATTPVDPKVITAMEPYWQIKFGNPASLYRLGELAEEAVYKARLILAETINAQEKEIVFTSSATESNNLAIKGLALANLNTTSNGLIAKFKKRILISAIEHDCVWHSAHYLKKFGYQIDLVPVDAQGLIKIAELEKMMNEDVLLVSIMHASNEIGSIQDIKRIGHLINQFASKFHVDAAQTLGKLNVDVDLMKIDLLTASSHKIYGPKGVGLLYKKKDIKLTPLLHGGGQEWGFRSSTLNVSGIVGFAEAVKVALNRQKQDAKHISQLRDKLINGVLSTISQSYLNGPTDAKNRLYNNANLRFEGIEGEGIILALDDYKISASTGSACSSAHLEPSRTLLATGLSAKQAHGSLRLSLGRWTSEKEIDQTLKVLPIVINKLRSLSPFKI